MTEPNLQWIVIFGCNEAVLRVGKLTDVDYPDDLGCESTAIYALEDVEVLAIWEKGHDTRVQIKRWDGKVIG